MPRYERGTIYRFVAIRDWPKEKDNMLARDNYSYKKYQKELAKKKKREEKEQRKRAASAPVSGQPLALSDGKGALSGQASNDGIAVV